MTYSVDDLREQYNLSTEGGDKEYTGKNAEDGHYWANDPDQAGKKVYLGHNDNLGTLLADDKLAEASKSTKHNHDTDVARGFAGLLDYKEITDSQKVQEAKERVSDYQAKYINYEAEDHPFYAAHKSKNKTATNTNSASSNERMEDKQQAASSFLGEHAELKFGN